MAANAISAPLRVRHEPTPRNPSIPITARISIELGFVQSCPDCRRIVQEFSAACVNDASVTRFVSQPGSKHCHDVVDGERALPLENGQPISDTNGSAPALVDAALLGSTNPLMVAQGPERF